MSGGRARKVVVIGDTVDIPIIFYPISYRKYQRGCSIISSGSADALAFATLLYLLEKEFGIIEGMATIMTGFSSNQRIVDGPSSNVGVCSKSGVCNFENKNGWLFLQH